MGIKSFQQPLVGSILVKRFLILGKKYHHFDDSTALSFDKNACSEACAIPILVRPINREIYYKEIGTAMPSPSLAKLAARSRAVTLPPASPSIDTLTAFADDDGLIRFIADTSHKCSN